MRIKVDGVYKTKKYDKKFKQKGIKHDDKNKSVPNALMFDTFLRNMTNGGYVK